MEHRALSGRRRSCLFRSFTLVTPPGRPMIAKISFGCATPVATAMGVPWPAASRRLAVFITAEKSSAPEAIAWDCCAPELMTRQLILTPSASKAFRACRVPS